MDLTVFFTINYGMYIVSTKFENKMNAQIVNTVFQVTAEPPKLAICISKNNFTCSLLEKSRLFSISALSCQAPMPFIGLFGFRSGKDIDKFRDTKYKTGVTGVPVVTDYCISYFECRIDNQLDVGTHIIYVGETVDAQFLNEGELLTYAYYRDVRHGLSPKNAPTYIKKQ